MAGQSGPGCVGLVEVAMTSVSWVAEGVVGAAEGSGGVSPEWVQKGQAPQKDHQSQPGSYQVAHGISSPPSASGAGACLALIHG